VGHVIPAINSIGESIAPVDTIISITALGRRVLRYGLALVIGWIGFIKVTGYDAHGIQTLVAHRQIRS